MNQKLSWYGWKSGKGLSKISNFDISDKIGPGKIPAHIERSFDLAEKNTKGINPKHFEAVLSMKQQFSDKGFLTEKQMKYLRSLATEYRGPFKK